MFMAGEKFHFSQIFSLRGKTSSLLYAIIFLILDFVGQAKTKDIARRNHPFSVRDELNLKSFPVLLYWLLTACTLRIVLEYKTSIP